VSVVRDAARTRVDWRDLDPFVVRDAKGKPDIEHELPRRTHVEHVERDSQHAESKGEMIARAHCARGTFDQLEPGPLRQFARVREEVPDALGGGENDVGRTHFHTTASLYHWVAPRRAWAPSSCEISTWTSATASFTAADSFIEPHCGVCRDLWPGCTGGASDRSAPIFDLEEPIVA
jgi:hypothetical protein